MTLQYNAGGTKTAADYTYGDGETADWTYNSDGSYQIAYAGVPGVNYASLTVLYNANGTKLTADYAYSNGETIDWTYSSGTYNGLAYSSYSITYSATATPLSQTYYSSSGAVVGTVIFAENDDGVLPAVDQGGADQTPAIELAAASVEGQKPIAAVAAVAPAVGQKAAPSVEALMLGATVPRSNKAGDVEKMFGKNEFVEALAASLFLGGVNLSSALRARGARTPRRDQARSVPLATFDILEDRLEQVADEIEIADLPSAMHSDHGEVDWIAMN